MSDVKDKWALITGASRGIGKEVAIFMAENGCNLILHSRNKSNVYEVEQKLDKIGVKYYSVEAELSNEEAIDRMLEEIDKLDLDIDFVFNNAGVQIAYRTDYYNTPTNDYDISFKINTTAPMKICYHFIPKMIKRGFGRIINTTSGIINEPEQAGYSASKAALDKVSIDLGTKLEGTNVLINLTDPGWCRTDLGGEQAPNNVKSTIPGVALGAFVDDGLCGRIIRAQEYRCMVLKDALEKLKRIN